MICKHCGKELKDGSKFCGYCGSSLIGEQSAGAPFGAEAADADTGYSTDGYSEENPFDVGDSGDWPAGDGAVGGGAWMPSDMPEEPEKKKKKTGYIVICSISGFVLVAGIVAAVVLLGLRGRKNDQDTLETSSQEEIMEAGSMERWEQGSDNETVVPELTPETSGEKATVTPPKQTPRPSPSPRPSATPKPTTTPKPSTKPTATPKPTSKPTATPKPTAKPSATPAPNTTVVANKYISGVKYSVIFRSAPEDKDSNKIGEVLAGAEVGYIEDSGSFAKIKYNGTYGYVSKKYLSDSRPYTLTDNTTVTGQMYVKDGAYSFDVPVPSGSWVDYLAEGTEVGFIEYATDFYSKISYNGRISYVQTDVLTSENPNPPTGNALYETYVQDAISVSGGDSKSRGLLYDLNGDGTDELVLLYKKNDSVMGAVYGLSGSSVTTLCAEAEAGSTSNTVKAGLYSYQGTKYFGLFWEDGTSSGYELYSISDSGYQVEHTISMYANGEGGMACTVNGRDASYDEVNSQLSSDKVIAYDGDGSSLGDLSGQLN